MKPHPFPNRGYLWIKRLKAELRAKGERRNVEDLLALDRNNDPFYCGSYKDWLRAEWFLETWQKVYETLRTHLRRMHYNLTASTPDKLGGTPYENHERDWKYLQTCSKAARYLDLVPADRFDDRRNADPYLANPLRAESTEPRILKPAESGTYWALPAVRLDSPLLNFWITAPEVKGYERDDYEDRDCIPELWIEKSTMNDVLVPLCRELRITLVTSIGYQSISNVVKLLQRVHETGKPARIFYVADADHAGEGMPVSVARQIEYFLWKYAPGADVKLTHLALTTEQIAFYKLPRDSEGRVELDALEAFHPGELEGLVRAAVEPYIDGTIADRLKSVEEEAAEIVEREWSYVMRPHRQRASAIRKEVKAVVDTYRAEVEEVNKRLQADMEKFQGPLEELRSDVNKAINKFEPELPERPHPVEREHGEDDWLFASSREYLEQLRHYKRHQGK